MKRLLACCSLLSLCSGTALAQPTASPQPKAAVHATRFKVAPADEYFGRLKLSILGIRNTIRDLGYKAGDPTQAQSLVATISFTEDAMHDWETKYPQDSWIPGALFNLERLYAKIDSDQARAKAKAVMLWLVHDYPRSAFAITCKKELAANQVGVKPPPPPVVTAADPAAASPAP